MEGNIHNHPTKISWEHCFFCRKKHTEGLKTCKKLENLANNSTTFQKDGKLELNWEALTELNENGEPNFYDSFIKHDAKFHWKCSKRFGNRKVQRPMKSQEKANKAESPVTRSSQPKKKFASLFYPYAVRMILIIICMQLGLFMQLKQTLIHEYSSQSRINN